MTKLKAILLTIVLLLASMTITFMLLIMCAIIVAYPVVFAIPVGVGLLALLLISAYQTADMLIKEREGKNNERTNKN